MVKQQSTMSSSTINSFGEVQMVKCIPTFMWTVTNFCACHNKTSDPLKSPIFSMGNSSQLKWSIHLYPKGFDKSYSDYISLFLQFESYDQGEVKAKYKFYLLNSKNSKTNEIESDSNRLFTPGCDWGFREFILRDVLFNEKKNLLPDNKLTMCCEINIIKCSSNIYGESITSLTMSDNQSRVLSDLETLLTNKKFSDVTFVVNDKKFYAHQAVLAARSQVFSDLFEKNMQEKRPNFIEVHEINQSILKEILLYIYTGRTENLDDKAIDILPSAQKYQLEGLKAMCEDAVSKTLNVDNAAEILLLADNNCAYRLKKEAMNFIISKADEVTNTEGFKLMVISQPHLIAEVFQTMAAKYNNKSEPPPKRKKST